MQRYELFEKLHEGYFRIDRTKLRARNSIYWPHINKDIEILVKTCDTCQENGNRNNKDPVLAREILICPWTMLELDLFPMDDHSFLLVVDVTSRFPVVRILNNETCKSVLNALKGIYGDYGLPRKVLCDNVPCFRVDEFVEFHTKLVITVKKSSLYSHQSLGCVEYMVQTAKQIMVRNMYNAWLVMPIFKATDIPCFNKSPSELLSTRKYRTNLPSIHLSKKSNETEIEKLAVSQLNRPKSGKELPKIPVSTPILYEQNPNSNKN